MDKKFKKIQKTNIRNHYQNLTEKLKNTNPKKFFSVMKEICNSNNQNKKCLPDALQKLSLFKYITIF